MNSFDQKNWKTLEFDAVLDEKNTQKEVFDCCEGEKLVEKLISGYNVTIIAYGQTGSGKTYTMEGYKYDTNHKPIIHNNPELLGLIPRVISRLFLSLNSKKNKNFVINANYIQIYKEKIFDLLSENSQNLKLRWSQYESFYIENLTSKICSSIEDLTALFQLGLLRKKIASHNMNKVSSRSHCLFTINIKKISTKGKILFSKFCLVDLAGSERVAVTGNQGQALKESIEINKSLFILRQVITSLSSNEKHIPFRDSKLTCLLSQSIGGNSWSILIACISPLNTNYEENVSTLMFATKTNTIFNIPTKNIDSYVYIFGSFSWIHFSCKKILFYIGVINKKSVT